MPLDFTRRKFARAGAAVSLATLLPEGVFSNTTAAKKAVIHADDEIGLIRPEFHSNFAEHLGSCTYGGIWVGKKSPIPNINGFRKATVDYLKELGVPVLRWPGGCCADDYHLVPHAPLIQNQSDIAAGIIAIEQCALLNDRLLHTRKQIGDRLKITLPAMSVATITLQVG